MNPPSSKNQGHGLTIPMIPNKNMKDDIEFRSTDSPLLRKHGFGLRQRIGKGDMDIDGIRKLSRERLF